MTDHTLFLTGGSGFVGSAVLTELLARDGHVRALLRGKPIDRPGVESVAGDLDDTAALDRGLVGCDAVVHLVGIIRETGRQTFDHVHVDGTRNLTERAKAAGVRRFVYLSALGAKADSASRYATTKFAAEEIVRQSGLPFTIFRPSVIHGPDGEFVKMVAGFARGERLPFAFMPYFGVGLVGHTPRKLQPVDVRDVARAVADAVGGDRLLGQTVSLVGSQVVDWRQLYQVIGEAATPKPRPTVGLPVWYGRVLTALLPKAWLPFNKSQVVMAGEDNVADIAVTSAHLGWTPRPFAASFREAWEQNSKR